MTSWRITVYVVILLAVPAATGGVDTDAPAATFQITDLQFTTEQFWVDNPITSEDGLPANGVNALLQDKKGYLWAATYNGLVRYDGEDIAVFNSSNVDGLTSNRFLSLERVPEGGLWAGLENNTLLRWTRDSARVYEIGKTSAYDHIIELEIGPGGRLWVGSSSGVFFRDDGMFHRPEALPREQVRDLIRHKDDLYILFRHRMFRVDEEGRIVKRFVTLNSERNVNVSGTVFHHLNSSPLSDLLIQGDNLYILFERGIVRAKTDGSNAKLLLKTDTQQLSTLHGIEKHPHKDKYLIFGSEGLFTTDRLTGKKLQLTRYARNNVLDLLVDHEGSIWFSTRAHGLHQLIYTPVYQGDRYKKLADIPLLSVTKEGGTLWVGTNCEGLYRFENGSYTKVDADNFAHACVWSLLKSNSGTLWMGTWGRGLFYMPPGTGQFRAFTSSKLTSNSTIFALNQDSNGHIWIGTYKEGLYRMEGDSLRKIPLRKGGDVPPIRSIYEDDRGRIWVASDGGIGYVKNDRVRIPNRFDQLSTRNFRTIAQDSAGRYYFGSYGGGLLVYDRSSGMLKSITADQGLMDETISQLAFDQAGNLWIGGNKGISFIEANQIKTFLEGDTNEVRISLIGVRKGLNVRETSGGFQPSHVMDEEGRFYVPLVQGLAVIHTDEMRLNRTPPNAVIDRIEIDGRPVTRNAIQNLSHDVKRLVFDFSALSYINPEAVRYQYRLSGFNERWQRTNGENEAVFTSLAPGDYTLKVRAANNDGFWNTKRATLSFTIKPPFWKQAWFLILAASLVVAGFLAIYRYRIRIIEAEKRRLASKVRERTRDLQETNQALKEHIQEKNKLFSIIAHDLRNPFSSIIGYMQLLKDKFKQSENEEDYQMAQEVLRSARNTHELLENLLEWANARTEGLELNREQVDLRELTCETIEMVSSQASLKEIEVDNRIATDTYHVVGDRNMLSTVIRNLLSNAIKFSPKHSTITIDAEDEEDQVVVSVTDEGEGISDDRIDLLFTPNESNRRTGTEGERGIGMGLMLCKEFVEKHGGEIWVDSEPGIGSTFFISIPKEEAAKSQKN